ncbi:hypothetical protein KTO58_26685 [Chitinophaga pendula]|uniref:hypothetical protein n=1 Tax=Chitinophaga TaxID=79328 RepID=UPI000BAFAB2E|nr:MULTISPECIES: hypothetical protein [Chitinophaga]ASZ09851.1 hypothetical protein CK934_02080 [Chitinophaga sp. MD30]UCJ07208.1 hypothetical protein KTO58_26685 [Chitinophaga pendula]
MKHFNTISIILLALLTCLPVSIRAQQADLDMKDKIRQLEVAYLAKQLDLTPEEAQGFWPLYNKYTHEVEQLIAARRSKQAVPENASGTTQKLAADGDVDKELAFDRKMLDIRSRYKQEFLKVLPAGKASSVFKTEREFRGQLLRHLKERRDAGRRGMPGRQRF